MIIRSLGSTRDAQLCLPGPIDWSPKGFELANDNKDLTIYLRKGMKWSGGQPFTAEGVLFWLNDRI